jgi:ATP-dependent DNA helicase RecG
LFVEAVFYRPQNSDKVSDSIGNVSDSIALSEQEEQIMQFLIHSSKIVSKDVEKLLGIKEARARRILKQMVEKGLIVRLGSGRSTCYTN